MPFPLAAFAVPAIGSAVGGLFSRFFGGGGKKDDEKEAGAELAPFLKQLEGSSKGLRAQAGDLAGMGDESLRPVLDYFKSVLGGDPNAIAEATRPERARVIDQYDTARRTISEFGGRGGGANAMLAGSQFDQANAIAGLTAEARRAAAPALGNLGTSLTGLGLSAQQLADADLSTILNTVLSKHGLNVQQRGQNAALAGGLAEGVGTLLGLFLTRGQGGGGGA